MELDKFNNNEFDLAELIKVIWKKKISIIVLSIVISIFNVFYALSLANVYTSDAVLAPNDDTQSNMSVFSDIGGLASLAGIDVGSSSSASDYNVTIRSLSSRQFLKDFIEERDLFLDIFAVSSYDLDTGKTEYDPTLYDVEKAQWVRKIQKPYLPKPSAYEVRETLLERLTIDKDNKTGFLFLTYTHANPNFAKYILDSLIVDINIYMKNRDIAFYERVSSSLLEAVRGETDKNLIKSIYSLLESNEKKLAIAKASNEYALKIIDQPIVPEKKSYPFRSKMVIIMSLLGGIFSTIFFVIYDHIKKIGGIRKILEFLK